MMLPTFPLGRTLRHTVTWGQNDEHSAVTDYLIVHAEADGVHVMARRISKRTGRPDLRRNAVRFSLRWAAVTVH